MSRIIIASFASASASGGARRAVLLQLLPIILGLAVLCLSLPSYAQDGVPAFSGIWRKDAFRFVPPYMFDYGDDQGVIDGFNNPFLQPWTAELLTEKQHSERNGRIYPNASSTCWPNGVPGVFGVRHIQILQLPDEIKIIYVNDHQVRQIALNQPHATPVESSWYGDSVAHFEGDTLVVDTTGFYAKPQAMVDDYGTPVSDALHVVERYSVQDEGTQLQVQVTVEDPNIFKKPWSMTVDYYADDAMLREARCAENNRDWLELVPMAERPDF